MKNEERTALESHENSLNRLSRFIFIKHIHLWIILLPVFSSFWQQPLQKHLCCLSRYHVLLFRPNSVSNQSETQKANNIKSKSSEQSPLKATKNNCTTHAQYFHCTIDRTQASRSLPDFTHIKWSHISKQSQKLLYCSCMYLSSSKNKTYWEAQWNSFYHAFDYYVSLLLQVDPDHSDNYSVFQFQC